jgi:hypothetical protein
LKQKSSFKTTTKTNQKSIFVLGAERKLKKDIVTDFTDYSFFEEDIS